MKPEDQKCRNNENDTHNGSKSRFVINDFPVNFYRQQAVVTTDQFRVTKVCEAIDRYEQECIDYARKSKLQCNGTEQLEAFSPEVLRSDFQVRRNGAQNSGNRHICQWEVGDRLYDP
ncbi:hypothetical protein D3C75_958790 [compost metagenome]